MAVTFWPAAVMLLAAGVAGVWTGLWWALSGPCVVMWLPWQLEPVVYTNSPWSGSAELFRARAWARMWMHEGRWWTLWHVLRAATRWRLLVRVSRAALRARRSHGHVYDEPTPGVKLSITLVEADWLATSAAARILGKTPHDCYTEVTA